jgi:citrate-Mg2+:H+ or citrate-Ca2+:H+ symporter, CitMHS family
MLAALGFATIVVFLIAIMTKRVSVLVALVLIPVVFGLLAGAGPDLGKMMLDGIVKVAPVGIMIIFAVLYFGLMLDVGLFDHAEPRPASVGAAATPADIASLQDGEALAPPPADKKRIALENPVLFWFNAALTIALVVALLMAALPLPILFILAFSIALVANYPRWEDQQTHLVSHSASVVTVSTMIFAAGIFTGVLTGTKMIEAMASATVSVIPDAMAGYLPLIVAVVSMPLSLVFTPDAFYFGVMPVLAQAAGSFGMDPTVIGRASILGQMTTGFPLSPLTASTFILIGLSGVTLGDHQRFIFPWAFGTTLVMTAVAYLTGAL